VGERTEDVVGKFCLTYYPPDEAPSLLLQRLDALLHDGLAVARRTHLRRAGEAPVPVEISVVSLGGNGGHMGHLVRVTEIGEGAAAQARPDAVLEDLVRLSPEEADALPYGLIVLDDDGVVVRYNEAESRLSGLPRNRVIGRQFFDEVAPCTRVRGLGETYRAMVAAAQPASTQLDFVFRFRSGERSVFVVMAYVPALEQGLLLIDPR
jgi:photoactive yellow protein